MIQRPRWSILLNRTWIIRNEIDTIECKDKRKQQRMDLWQKTSNETSLGIIPMRTLIPMQQRVWIHKNIIG